ncbi:class I SAM-dependent methyltransferase [Clostridium diolis]|uniref:Methyltransferase type 11 n=1 Tax=Clostridium diolis TaxID=223919 RepID=A0AAV3W8W4_9CLOT|nr:methyltransferase domain-containing protein [Clostridium diolis]QES74332.1 methyltransferase domain-containing protein [Clostridium diolis]GEA34088.1 methyltransferase type 11 [Clostridium diolis]
MMTHKLDAKDTLKIENEKRRKILPPEQTLINLDLQTGDVMADIGCGIGYFTIPASKIVGKNGKILALDISDEMLQDVEEKIIENDISNVEAILTEENHLKLESNSVTFAFASNIIHEVEEKERFLNEIKRIICPEGKIAILEWEKIDSNFGPPIERRLDRMDLIKLLDELNFSTISTIDIGEDFYGIIAQK